MPDTGAPYEIPYLDGTEFVKDYPQASEDLADAIVDALDGIPVLAGIGSNVVQTVKTDTFSSTTSTYANVTGLTVTISPSSATSKVLVIAQVSWGIEAGGSNDENINFRLAGGNISYEGASPGSRIPSVFGGGTGGMSNMVNPGIMVFLDSPATTSATTYSVQIRRGFAVGTMYVNRAGSDANENKRSRGASSITVIEVAP
jgi:hypothetical protein